MNVKRVPRALSVVASIGLVAFLGPISVALAGQPDRGGHDRGPRVVRARTTAEIATAIEAANGTGRAVVIRLAPGTYPAGAPYTSDYGASWLPPVRTEVSIEGAGSDATILSGTLDQSVAAPGMRTFTVVPGGRLVIRGMTIKNNFLVCRSTAECDTTAGGAILNVEGTVWIERSVLSRNVVIGFDGIPTAFGGAVLSTRGHLHIEDSLIEDNESMSSGGGVAILAGSATILRSSFRGNHLSTTRFDRGYLRGGGLLARDAAVWIAESTFSANMATVTYNASNDDYVGFGGAIATSGGTLWMKNSSVVENTAGSAGTSSTFVPASAGSGGGILNGGRMVIENSTIAGNSAGTLGGGIFNSSSLLLRGVTLARNEVAGVIFPGPYVTPLQYPPGCNLMSAPQLCFSRGGGIWNEPTATAEVANTVIADNTKQGGAVSDCSGLLTSKGRNALGSDGDCVLQPANGSTPADLRNLPVGLGALRDNGEPGYAHIPPLPGSPLIDAGGAVWDRCTLFDQIDHVRNDGDGDGRIRCDIGAVEVGRLRGR